MTVRHRCRGDSTGRVPERSPSVGHPERSAIAGHGLWTAPELWKTHKPRFPQARWTARPDRAPPTRSTGILVVF